MIQGFSHHLNPIGTKALENTRKYSEHVPDVYEATYVLEELLDEFTVQYCGSLEKPLSQTTSHTSRKIIATTHKGIQWLVFKESQPNIDHRLSHHLLMKSLLGTKQLGILNANVREEVRIYSTFSGIRAKVKLFREALHKVVALEISLINIATGRIEPGIESVVEKVFEQLNLQHIIYLTGPHTFAALLNFGTPLSYSKATSMVIGVCREVNALAPTYIRLENSSLVTPIPFPLSITNQTFYCQIKDKNAAESIALVSEFLAYKREIVEETLTAEEEITLEETSAASPSIDPFSWRVKNDFVVSRTFYTGNNKLIGKDKNRDKIRKLLGYLLFSSFRDDEGNLILSSRKICILLNGDDKMVEQNNFNLSATLKLLDPFVTLSTTKHSYKNNKATTLETARYIEDIRVLAAREHRALRKDLVWLSNGESCDDYERYKIEKQRKRAEESKLMYPCPIARTLMDTLNNLSPHTFTRAYNNHIEEVLERVEGMDGESRSTALWKLQEIRLQPVPIYHQSLQSNRLQPTTSFARLNKDLRNIFFKGEYIADLKHAQLSINTMLWGCKELERELIGGDGWNRLEQSIGLDKTTIKELLYPFVYNIDSPEVSKVKAEDWKIRTFLSSKPINSLMRSRDSYLRESRSIGYRTDAFGNRVILRRGGENSFLSLLSQSYEMYLLEDIFNWYIDYKSVNTSKSFSILLYLFDGFIFTCNIRDYERISNRLKLLVDKECSNLNIHSSLVISKL